MQEDEGNSGSFPEIPRPRTSETEMLLDRDNPFRKIAVVQQEEEVDDVGPRRSDPPPLVSGSGPRENSKRGPPSGPLALSSGNFDRRQHPTSSGRVAKDSVTSPGNSTASAPASQSEEYDYPTDYNKDIRSERFAASEFSCRKLCQNPVAVTLIILGTLLLITIVGTSAWCCISRRAEEEFLFLAGGKATA
ncbi:unnamed protein product [Amoebophrya sp. A120]|nr:unnamed protein product [Amoebophrya sp. A120]|eukprot:GSA120T00002166001.1